MVNKWFVVCIMKRSDKLTKLKIATNHFGQLEATLFNFANLSIWREQV